MLGKGGGTDMTAPIRSDGGVFMCSPGGVRCLLPSGLNIVGGMGYSLRCYGDRHIISSKPNYTTWNLKTSTPTWVTYKANVTGRLGSGCAKLGGSYYFTCGRESISGVFNAAYETDVWKSTNLIEWTRIKTNMNPKMWARLIVFNNEIYMLGGQRALLNSSSTEVLKTSDGITWTEVVAEGGLSTSVTAFGRTPYTSAVVFLGKIYLFSERFGNPGVYSSSDGSTWNQEADTAAVFGCSFRRGSSGCVHNGYYYLAGGFGTITDGGAQDERSDVWRTANGQDWDKVANDGAYSKRLDAQMISRDGSIYILPGHPALNKIAQSTDGGVTWTDTETPGLYDIYRMGYSIVTD